MKLVKQCLPTIVKPLCHISNCSLQSGVVPDQLKWAKFIHIFKKGDPSLFSNYRPIYLLPCFSKILEKIVYNRLIAHLKDNNLLYDYQFGFRAKHSTSMALVQLVNRISTALDNKELTIGVFIDLSKAFDTVDPNILLTKLQAHGVSGTELNWFKSYLFNRKQYTYCFLLNR